MGFIKMCEYCYENEMECKCTPRDPSFDFDRKYLNYKDKYERRNGKTCPSIEEEFYRTRFFEVDCNIFAIIKNLNKAGYRTKFCCESHPEISSCGEIYIQFDTKEVEFLIEAPGQCIRADKNGSIRYPYPKKATLEEKIQLKQETLSKLLDWSKELLNDDNEVNLFVYGTLMQNNPDNKKYLQDSKFLGRADLAGYSLYDNGQHPVISYDVDGAVKGELYSVSFKTLKKIKEYEGKDNRFKRVLVFANGSVKVAWTSRVYGLNNKSLKTLSNEKQPYEKLPWQPKVKEEEYVWYACYGSNINRERFYRYINSCKDTSKPKLEEKVVLSYELYFANKSVLWGNQGVAFIDPKTAGKTYGKMYLIKKDQFDEIKRKEGTKYSKEMLVGETEGVKIYTFTSSRRTGGNVPSPQYLETIKVGLLETWTELPLAQIEHYLFKAALNEYSKKVLMKLLLSPHRLSVSQLFNGERRSREYCCNNLQALIHLKLIKMDSRDVERGYDWNDPEACYYTVPENRSMIGDICSDGGSIIV